MAVTVATALKGMLFADLPMTTDQTVECFTDAELENPGLPLIEGRSPRRITLTEIRISAVSPARWVMLRSKDFCLEGQVRHVVALSAGHRVDQPKPIHSDVNDLAQFRIIFDFQDRQR